MGFPPALPTPTVARGAVMRHDSDGRRIGDEHAAHARPPATPVSDEHATHNMPAATLSAAADTLAVAGIVDGFHAALAAGDSTTALGLLEEEATILESGARQTKAEYRSGHLSGDMRFAALHWSSRRGA